MILTVKSLSSVTLTKEELRVDKKAAVPYGPCALGEKAIYLSLAYLPLSQVQRVYKRLAVSKGFYEKDAIFGSLAYLVIMYDGGSEKVIRFDHEDELDALLQVIRSRTDIAVGKLKKPDEVVA